MPQAETAAKGHDVSSGLSTLGCERSDNPAGLNSEGLHRGQIYQEGSSPPESQPNVEMPRNVNSPTSVRILDSEERDYLEQTAMTLLMRYRIPGTELDSSARYPPPRCHPATRETLLARMTTWFGGSRRDGNLLWLYGPPGIGKSAVAQTVAEHCRDKVGQLGAAFFFSASYRFNDPARVFPSLACQLAIHYPPYKKLVCQLLTDNPTVLDQSLSVQFKELIARPLSTLKGREGQKGQLSLLIVLDGLDECEGERAQVQIMELISTYTGLHADSPLRWIISSRPEPHLQSFFSTIQAGVGYRKEEMVFDERDVVTFLQDGFREMRQRHWDIFDATESWPSSTQMSVISKAAFGPFVFASALLRFVGDVGTRDPKSRLEAWLNFIEISSVSAPGEVKLRPLDLLYAYILSDLPESIRPIALRILGFCTYFPGDLLSAQALANFFSLDQITFYQALRPLHAVLNVPEPSQANTDPLRFYHTSLKTFFKDLGRSGQWHIQETKVYSDVAILSIRWLNYFAKYSCTLSRGKACCSVEEPLAKLQWTLGDSKDALALMDAIKALATKMCWEACEGLTADDFLGVIQELRRLDTCPLHSLTQFLQGLSNQYPENEGTTSTQRSASALTRRDFLLYVMSYLFLVPAFILSRLL